jgi:hypothetical protein
VLASLVAAMPRQWPFPIARLINRSSGGNLTTAILLYLQMKLKIHY